MSPAAPRGPAGGNGPAADRRGRTANEPRPPASQQATGRGKGDPVFTTYCLRPTAYFGAPGRGGAGRADRGARRARAGGTVAGRKRLETRSDPRPMRPDRRDSTRPRPVAEPALGPAGPGRIVKTASLPGDDPSRSATGGSARGVPGRSSRCSALPALSPHGPITSSRMTTGRPVMRRKTASFVRNRVQPQETPAAA
jgi:hypothetical protein